MVVLGNAALSGKLDKKALRDHRSKQKHGVTYILLVNSRVSRIYGRAEDRFAQWFRDDELFCIRNRALYLELGQEGLVCPDRAIGKEDSYLLVCFAGEILAEIQGGYTAIESEKWQALLAKVDSFRETNAQLLKRLKGEDDA